VISGVRLAQGKVSESSEGVYVVTVQQKNLYKKAGFQLMNEGNVVPSMYHDCWLLKGFPWRTCSEDTNLLGYWVSRR
jgi:hypothetical protein